MKSFILILWALMSLLSFQAFAQTDPNDALPADDAPGMDRISELEKIDLHSGTTTFNYGGPNIPGPNGMNLSLSWILDHSTNADYFSPAEMGYAWKLDIPVIVGASNCASPTSTTQANKTNLQGGPYLRLPGQEPKPLLTPSGAIFSGVKYITNDNWTATCVGADWRVRSPSGMVYRFYRTPALNNSSYIGNCDQILNVGCDDDIYVSRIEDLYGNWIQYSYNIDFSTGITMSQLTKITRSDGALINLIYSPVTGPGQDYPLPSGTVIPGTGMQTWNLLTSVTANQHKWTFKYGACYNNLTGTQTIDFCSGNLLKSFTRPDGLAYTFSYTGNTRNLHVHGHGQGSPYVFTPLLESFTTPANRTQAYTYWTARNSGTIGSNQRFYSISSKTYSGPGLPAPITTSYYYYVNPQVVVVPIGGSNCTSNCWQYQVNGVPYTGNVYQYTYVIGPTKMLVNKYLESSNYSNGKMLILPNAATAAWDKDILVETGIFPAPPLGTIPNAPPLTEPITPAPEPVEPPSLSFSGDPTKYGATNSITINFSDTSTLPIIWAQCSLNGSAYIPCTTLTTYIATGLTPGSYTLTVEIQDAFGNWSSPTKFPFTVVPR